MVFDVIRIQKFLWIFYIYYRNNYLGSKALLFYFKMFKSSALFNSPGTLFQRISPTVLKVSKSNLPVFMFHLFTVTPELRLQELVLLKLKISLMMGGERSIFCLVHFRWQLFYISMIKTTDYYSVVY